MNLDQTAFGLVATTLAKEFDSLYYVDTETDNFIEFFHFHLLLSFYGVPVSAI